MPDPLDTVLRIRRTALDDALRHLAGCLRVEGAAHREAEAADAAIGVEGEIAADLAGEDGAVAAFAAWLPVGRARAAAARAASDAAVAETGLARAAMTLTRAAMEAAAALADRRSAERNALAERRAQAVLDEIGSRARPGVREFPDR